MGLIKKLFGKSGNQMTAEQLAGLCFAQALKGAWDGPASLYESLKDGIGAPISNEFGSETEVLIFALLPFDVVVAGRFGPEGGEVRERMANLVVETAKSRLSPVDREAINWAEWPDHIMKRWESYVEAFLSKPQAGNGMHAIGLLAYKNITGTDGRDPTALDGRMLCGAFFGTAYPEISKWMAGVELKPQ